MADSSSLTVLRCEKDLSTSWLEELLKHNLKSDIEVVDWTSRPPAAKSGFMSEMCFVELTFKGPKHTKEERSLVVKFAPTQKNLMEFMRNGNLARKEIRFYKFVSTDEFQEFCEKSGLKNPVPYVYWADIEDELITLVMNDLTKEGYRGDTPIEGNSLEQVKTALKSVAVIHACGIAAIKKHGREYLEVPYGNFLEDFLKIGLDKHLELYKGTRMEGIFQELYSKTEDLMKSRHPFFETLIHGDFWSGNIMFSHNNTSAVIIDWQFACIDNPVCDILVLLLISSHPLVYEEHLNEVLDTYWKSLNEALEKNGTSIDKNFQDLLETVEAMWIYGFMFFTAAFPDLLEAEIMSVQRAKHVVSFLEKKGVFSKFLKQHNKESASL